MESVISVANMRESDEHTIACLTGSLELMERAARGIRSSHDFNGRTLIVTGSGNNGGDGFALAEILLEEGKETEVVTVTDHCSADSEYYMKRAVSKGLKVIPFTAGSGMLKGYDTIVDCLLGTGFSGEVRGRYRDAILEINEVFGDCFVLSADINSGMNGDTGKADIAVRSHLTVTIGALKTGLLLARGGSHIRRITCAHIGITPLREENFLLEPGEWELRGIDPGLFVYEDSSGALLFKNDESVNIINV